MNVTCQKCGKRYVIADEKLAGKAAVKIRCKQCQNLIHIATGAGATAGVSSSSQVSAGPTAGAAMASGLSSPAPKSPWDDEATRAMPAPDLTSQWFAMIQGKQEGPLDFRGLASKATSGEITLRTYLWKPGMDGWKRAADVPEVSAAFAVGAPGANATATGPMQAMHAARAAAPARDVAVANELPASDFSSVSQIMKAPAAAEAVTANSPAHVPGGTNGAPLRDLFGDVHESNSAQTNTSSGPSGVPLGGEYESKGQSDPFAQMGEPSASELPPPGEATKFFIAQAGVNRRNPPWKIALFVLSVVVAPATLLYLLSTLQILPTVTVVNAEGEEKQENFFSAEGIGSLKDALTGDATRKKAEAEEKRKRDLAAKRASSSGGSGVVAGGEKQPPKTEKPTEPAVGTAVAVPKQSDAELAALYGNDQFKTTKAPRALAGDTNSGPAVATAGGLSNDAAMKIVGDKRKAFEQCIDAALRRSPNLAVGNVVVTLTVAGSGVVKSVGVAPKKWEGADWAQCMVGAGKRIVFPSSEGGDTDIEVPFKVGVAL